MTGEVNKAQLQLPVSGVPWSSIKDYTHTHTKKGKKKGKKTDNNK